MGALADTLHAIAGGDINPACCVKVDTDDNTVVVAEAATDLVIGVADRSTRLFDSGLHAVAGEPVTLQSGDVVLVRAGGTITRGDRLQPSTGGTVITAVTTATGAGVVHSNPLVALESGSSGNIIRAFWAKNETGYNNA